MTVAPPSALAELQRWPRWVVWRTVERDGKPTKVPFQPNGKPASSTDSETWSTYEQAAEALERGRYDGIGYVFADDDEYTGVDLDHCVIEGCVLPAASAILRRLNSYTELSPSGTGVHILIQASLNGGRNRTKKTPWGGDFESYDRGRFFTVTGRHLPGTPETIEARQEEFDAIRAELFPPEAKVPPVSFSNGAGPSTLDDRDLLERASKAKNGADFDRLWRGDISGHGEDESAADLALCNMLAFWAGPDPARIDSLFRRSGLMRDKWDSARGESTYGAITIDKALEGRTEFYGQGRRQRRPTNDDVGRNYGEELAEELMLVDDPFVAGWKSGRTSRDRYMLTTRSGLVLDLDPIGSYAGSPSKLAAEAALQLGTEPDLKGKVLRVLHLMAAFCDLEEAVTLDDQALDMGVSFLQEANLEPVDIDDQADRWRAFRKLRDVTLNKSDSIAAQSTVLVDGNGLRYVRASWFGEYVKASAMPGTASDVNKRMLRLGWMKTGRHGRIKATSPDGARELVWSFHVVPRDWEKRPGDAG